MPVAASFASSEKTLWSFLLGASCYVVGLAKKAAVHEERALQPASLMNIRRQDGMGLQKGEAAQADIM